MKYQELTCVGGPQHGRRVSVPDHHQIEFPRANTIGWGARESAIPFDRFVTDTYTVREVIVGGVSIGSFLSHDASLDLRKVAVR